MEHNTPKPFMNPYLAGIGLGLVLLLTFIVAGRGLGASGAMTRITAYTADKATFGLIKENKYLNGYLGGSHPLDDFLVYMLIGVFIGGIVSGAFSSRLKGEIIRGQNTTNKRRLRLAFAGGILSAIGARLAGGCTSGQALTGGATLAVGSWLFVIAVFAGGFSIAYFLRREWL